MIVIVIIGVVYTLAVTNLKSVSEEKVKPNFSNLKEYLHSFLKEDDSSARLLCLDDCSECGVYVDGVKRQEQKSFFDSSVEVYTYDFLQGAKSREEPVYFNKENVQEKVCFSLSVDKNLISDQVMIVYKDKAYDFTTYFRQTPVYDSIEELVDVKQARAQELR